jgi:hypothetical protein
MKKKLIIIFIIFFILIGIFFFKVYIPKPVIPFHFGNYEIFAFFSTWGILHFILEVISNYRKKKKEIGYFRKVIISFLIRIQARLFSYHYFMGIHFLKIHKFVSNCSYIYMKKILAWRVSNRINYHLVININLYLLIFSVIVDSLQKQWHFIFYAFLINFFYNLISKYISFLVLEHMILQNIRSFNYFYGEEEILEIITGKFFIFGRIRKEK